MKVIIFGASGTTGIQLVQQALNNGHTVTAFVRDLHKLSLNHANLSLVKGNVGDFDIVQQAVAGQDAVLSALGAHSVFKFDPVIVRGLDHIVNTMALQQVQRLVYLSTLGVAATRHNAGFMIRTLAPTVLRHEVSGHEIREKIIRDSSLQWTILRAPILTNGAITKRYRSEEHLVSKQIVTSLSRADVAHCMLSQLTNGRFVRRSIGMMA